MTSAPSDRLKVSGTAPALAAFVAAAATYLTFTQKLFGDGDVFWHLATGQLILGTKSVPTSDPFAYTTQGQAWHAHEWLAEVLMALSFAAGGWAAVALLFAAAVGTTLLILGTELSRRLPLRWALCALFVVFMLLHPLLTARPHVFGWLMLASWVALLSSNPRRPTLGALPMMVVWANLHASYILGLGIAGAFAVEGVLRDRSTIWRWAAFVAGCILCVCLTPQGVSGLLYPFQVSGMAALAVIGEWRPTNPADDPLFLLFLVAVWGLIIVRRRQIHPVRILVLAGLTAMAVAHARHQMPFVIVATIFAAPLLGSQRPVPEKTIFAIALVLLGMVATVRLISPFEPADSEVFPRQAIRSVPADIRDRPVFNSYSFGGPLILAGIKPYIDGRADIYGDAFTLDYTRMLRGDLARFEAADRRWHFGWVILDPRDELANRLASNPNWSRTYGDANAVIFQRARPEPTIRSSNRP